MYLSIPVEMGRVRPKDVTVVASGRSAKTGFLSVGAGSSLPAGLVLLSIFWIRLRVARYSRRKIYGSVGLIVVGGGEQPDNTTLQHVAVR